MAAILAQMRGGHQGSHVLKPSSGAAGGLVWDGASTDSESEHECEKLGGLSLTLSPQILILEREIGNQNFQPVILIEESITGPPGAGCEISAPAARGQLIQGNGKISDLVDRWGSQWPGIVTMGQAAHRSGELPKTGNGSVANPERGQDTDKGNYNHARQRPIALAGPLFDSVFEQAIEK